MIQNFFSCLFNAHKADQSAQFFPGGLVEPQVGHFPQVCSEIKKGQVSTLALSEVETTLVVMLG